MHGGQLLHEAIVARCRELKISGATVLQGLEGYGETAEMHRAHLLHGDRPIVIAIVDSAENIARLLSVLEDMIGTGVMAVSDVSALRVQKPKRAV